MSAWIIWRLLKFIGATVLAGGVTATLIRPDRRGRMLAAQWLATPGWLLTWIAGYGLMKFTGLSYEPWILAAMLTSLISLHGTILYAQLAQPRRLSAVLASGGLFAAVATMVTRSTSVLELALVTVIGFAAGLPFAWLSTPAASTSESGDLRSAWQWFRWCAWLEGASLVTLLLIYMPLKYGAGIKLDGGTGLVGWIHGILLLVYLQALQSTGSLLGWSLARRFVAFVAAMLPFGTFVLERRLAPYAPQTAAPQAAAPPAATN